MERITLFADVILPLPVKGLFTYRIPFELNKEVKIGQRVVVQFGKHKIYSAIVRNIHQNIPQTVNVKYILSFIDTIPVVNEIQLKFWEWIADYYMCSIGEVMNAALPPAFKLESETKVMLSPMFDKDYSLLNEKEYLVVSALEKNITLNITEVSKIVEQIKVIPLIKTMMEKNIIITEEELQSRYKPKTETYVRLTEKYNDEKNLKAAFDKLEKKAFKQLELLMSFVNLSKRYSKKQTEVLRETLIKDADTSTAQLNALIKKGIFELYNKEVSRLEHYDKPVVDSITFSDHQEEAFTKLKNELKEKDVVLLHGITSSGKTEIYTKLIQETINQGKQVLYLLPEIAITAQIINRLRRYLGNIVGVYHSKFNLNERYEIWNRILAGKNELAKSDDQFKVVLGARSALFMPFSNLGLIIVDEEHETTFKQYNPSPRYNARDAAIYLAQMHHAKTIIGSATPAIESFYNAENGKYGLVELNKRYGDVMLPEVLVVDIKEETKRKKMKSNFSPFLLEHIGTALKNHEQVILFQNRRGFSPRIVCNTCNWMPQCKNCDVTLTYHKHNNQLRCHYCGYYIKVPEKCEACSGTELLLKGFGTEKIEEELPLFFPDAKVKRMDLDTTSTKHAYQQIINDFEDGKIDILVGTQMVTKGLDFDNVSLVGIMNADNMLSFPDFRAFERSYQLMAQVSGRAGRKQKRGKVIIQTYSPYHPIILNVIDHDYRSMYVTELLDRRNFKYPPFYRLIELTLKHKKPETLNEAAKVMAEQLKKIFGKDILGPEYPLVSRISTFYLKNILLKTNKDHSFSKAKTQLQEQINLFKNIPEFKSVLVQIDVDPV